MPRTARPVQYDVLMAGADGATARQVLEVLACRGIRGTLAADFSAAVAHVEQRRWDLVLVDEGLSGGSRATEGTAAPRQAGAAFDLVRLIRERRPEAPVVMTANQASVKSAVRAVREGCYDFLLKPLARADLESLLDTLLPNRAVPVAAGDEADGPEFVLAGRSPRLFETIALARKVAPTSIPVIITGESGTGKELVSYLVHRCSRRANGPYVRVNCAAVSESLLESELFGHERGAFTGAVVQRKGRFEQAHGGTLLLDEISESSCRFQAELLRVLEQQDFHRVGGTDSVAVNVRIISTTNRDLAAEVQRGRFRADLFYRLGGVQIEVPPLRHRKEDIPVLVWHFVNLFAAEARRRITQLDPEMMDLFLHYDWPGNVRQLRNLVRTALVVGTGEVLSLSAAPWLRAELTRAPRSDAGNSLKLSDVERQTIMKALALTRSHQANAARLLGITDRTLREKLRRYRREGLIPATSDVPGLEPSPADRHAGPPDEVEAIRPAGEKAAPQVRSPCVLAEAETAHA